MPKEFEDDLQDSFDSFDKQCLQLEVADKVVSVPLKVTHETSKSDDDDVDVDDDDDDDDSDPEDDYDDATTWVYKYKRDIAKEGNPKSLLPDTSDLIGQIKKEFSYTSFHKQTTTRQGHIGIKLPPLLGLGKLPPALSARAQFLSEEDSVRDYNRLRIFRFFTPRCCLLTT